MILSTLLDRRSRYEIRTMVEEIKIQPTILVPTSSQYQHSVHDPEDATFDFERQRIMNNGHVYWLEEQVSVEDEEPLTLPGNVEDGQAAIDSTLENWVDSFERPGETATEPVFNLLPNGRRKRSLRSKVRHTLLRTFNYRRLSYAVDSKTTSLGDKVAESSSKMKRFLKNTSERLRPTEASWTNLEELFAEAYSHFIPLPHMTPVIPGF